MNKSYLAERMKKYEQVSKNTLVKRMPVAIRLDGKSFHTFTKGMQKPFDDVLIETMQSTMKYLCENVQNCVLGYTQSDEITLILVDYKELNTSPWFDNKVQKICSISASMTSNAFNREFLLNIDEWGLNNLGGTSEDCNPKLLNFNKAYWRAAEKGAIFDSRCFNIPKEEVTNLLLWRQLDAIRNSILSVGQYFFSQNELYSKSCNDIKNMLLEKSVCWDNLSTVYKLGSCCIKMTDFTTNRKKWIIDNEIPIFKGDGREYIEKLVNI